MLKNRQNGPILKGPDLKPAKFKASETYNLKYFGQVEKIFIFFIFVFYLNFRIFKSFESFIFFHSESSFQRGISFNNIFYPSRAIYQNVRTANCFKMKIQIIRYFFRDWLPSLSYRYITNLVIVFTFSLLLF